MTDKPSPATEFDEAQRLLISIARSPVGTRPKYLVGIALGAMLPSSCSSSHVPIRYTGEKCPMCEALLDLKRYQDLVSTAAITCPEYVAGQDLANARNCWRYCNILTATLHAEGRAINGRRPLSRPSEAPAPMPKWTCPGPGLAGYDDLHKPGAGEEGK